MILSQGRNIIVAYSIYMPLLKEHPEELGEDEWQQVKKAMKEYEEGNFVTEEEIMAKYGIK